MIKKIKWFFQRGKRGYSDYDVGDLSSYIPKLLSSALKDFKKKMEDDIKWYPEKSKDYSSWTRAINKMIKAFDAILYFDTHSDFRKKYKRKKKDMEEGLSLFIKHIRDLWI